MTTDLLAAAKRLGEARRGRAQTWLLSRYDAKTDNYATAVADEQWALELTMAEAEYELAKRAAPSAVTVHPRVMKDYLDLARESEDSNTSKPSGPSSHAHAESDHCDQ